MSVVHEHVVWVERAVLAKAPTAPRDRGRAEDHAAARQHSLRGHVERHLLAYLQRNGLQVAASGAAPAFTSAGVNGRLIGLRFTCLVEPGRADVAAVRAAIAAAALPADVTGAVS